MLFSSLLFLWAFLPLVLLLTLALPRRWHNGWLLLASLGFYAWGGVGYALLLLLSISFNYVCGLLLPRYGRLPLLIGVAGNLLLLGFYKYANFIALNINGLLEFTRIPAIELPPVALPLGISFFTFQAISYLVDVHRQTVAVQRSPFRLGLYISFFPQLIAGPIVRYHDIDRQIERRTLGWEQFSAGCRRFLIGLGKKVLLANTFAALADEIFALDPHTLDAGTAWAGVLLYSLQIYFDFSGYSDMAIGLGRLFGFELPENFNYPYIARTVRDFWRRWHISLSEWFRDYLYFPLGGSHGSNAQTYRNLLVVFFLTGLWHGASWNFVVWGLWHGLFMVLERQRWFPALPRLAQHIYLLLVVVLGWVLFRVAHFEQALAFYRAMFGLNGWNNSGFAWSLYWNRELALMLGIGLLACTPFFRNAYRKIRLFLADGWSRKGLDLGLALYLYFILLYTNLHLVNSSYNPFIYFRF